MAGEYAGWADGTSAKAVLQSPWSTGSSGLGRLLQGKAGTRDLSGELKIGLIRVIGRDSSHLVDFVQIHVTIWDLGSGRGRPRSLLALADFGALCRSTAAQNDHVSFARIIRRQSREVAEA
jgi:hypothetical protein